MYSSLRSMLGFQINWQNVTDVTRKTDLRSTLRSNDVIMLHRGKALSYPRQARKQASGDPSGRVGNDDVNKGAWQEFCFVLTVFFVIKIMNSRFGIFVKLNMPFYAVCRQ